MVLRIVERGEVVPVGFDFGAVGDVEADRAEYRLDALLGAGERMQAPAARAAPRERDVERLLRQPRIELPLRQRVAPLGERGLELVLRRIDAAAGLAPRFRRKFAQPLEQIGQHSGLAEKMRLRLFQFGGIIDAAELLQCGTDYFFQIIHFHVQAKFLGTRRIARHEPLNSPR